MNPGLSSRAITFLDSWLRFRSERCDIPGFAVGISHKGEMLLEHSYGFATQEKGEQLSNDHLFRIASHSKTFAGTALMQLREREKLDIDKPIVNYLPWLKEHRNKRMSKITTRQLLSHSAGVIRDGLDSDYWELDRDFPDAKQLKAELLKADLVLDCNRKMKYSNYGYALLGMIVEACSGTSFAAYVQANIIELLDLKNTGPEYTPAIAERLVSGYARAERISNRSAMNSRIDTKSMSAATGFYSNCRDLCRYFSAHIIGSDLLLDDESKKEMQRTQWKVTNSKYGQEYGLGLQIDYVGNRRVFGHAGGFPGQASRTLCDPDSGFVVVVLTNAVDADPTGIARGIYSLLDHFCANESTNNVEKLARFEGRLMSTFRVNDLLMAGPNKLISLFSNSWQPFCDDVEELEYVDENTLKMVKCNGFACEGELVHFNFAPDGSITSVRFGGTTMLPEKAYLKQ